MELTERQVLRVHVLLTVHSALLGHIHPSVRRIAVLWSESDIVVSIFHDGEPTEIAVELASYVETELMAGFPDHAAEVRALPDSLAAAVGEWVYVRWEPDE